MRLARLLVVLPLILAACSTSSGAEGSGGTDADAAGWDVGYLQTVQSSARVGHYTGSSAASTFTVSLPANTRDGNPAGVAPWYDSKNASTNRNASSYKAIWVPGAVPVLVVVPHDWFNRIRKIH